MTKNLKLGYVKAHWHAELVNQTQIGFEAALNDANQAYDLTVKQVPGALEMPLIAQRLAMAGGYDGIVCAALVVDGGIYRHEFVAQAVVDGIVQVGLKTDVPIYSVSLTPQAFQETETHIAFFKEHLFQKGAEAAAAVLEMAKLSQL